MATRPLGSGFVDEEPGFHDDSSDEILDDRFGEDNSSSDEKPPEKTLEANKAEEVGGPSGTNVSVDRDFTIKAAVPPVIYQLEWHDGGSKKPSFYSSTPFTNLTIVKASVSKKYQAPKDHGKDKPDQPIIEVVTRINGTAERDKPALPPPPPQLPLPFPTIDTVTKKPKPSAGPKPYKLEEISIESLGKTRILVHSRLLVRALKSIITYYPFQRIVESAGIIPRARDYSSDAQGRGMTSIVYPYMALMHHRAALVEFSKHGNDEYRPSNPTAGDVKDEIDVSKMMEHMQVLLSFFDPHYQKFMEKAGDRLWKVSPVVTFEEAWYLFPPGTDVYVDNGEKRFAAVVIGTRYDSEFDLEIKAWYLEFDGTNLTRRSVVVYIAGFEGEQEVISFDVCPAKIWDIKDGGKRRKAFESRGETIFRLCQGRHKQVYYNGPNYDGEKFKGLVIIDNQPIKNLDYHDALEDDTQTSMSYTSVTTSRERRSQRARRVTEVKSKINRNFSPTRGFDPCDESTSGSGSDYESSSINKLQVKRGGRLEFKWAKYNDLTTDNKITGHHYMLFHPHIMGFAVLSKKWRIFHLDYVSEVPKREDMIDKVVMESAKQQIIKAISHPQNHAWKLDFIQGKGEGQIILLHGPPGVGKTYTVECAAEATGRPLLFLTIADIGLDEKRIEEQMTKWFSLAERWEAILLIDEADIFLERRRGADIARNGLVSVFLRKMEYFQGLLFLTTNRIGQIDDAFLSRIHVVIGYTPLTDPQRATIWKGFFRKLEHDMKVLTAQHAKHDHNRESRRESKDRKKGREKEREKARGEGKKGKGREEPTKRAERLVKVQVSEYAQDYVLNDPEVRALKWNGREIRNAFQTAISLAGFEAAQRESEGEERDDDRREARARKVTVSKEHFVSVVKMSKEFHSYMNSISLQEEGERARGRLERNDAFGNGDGEGVGSY